MMPIERTTSLLLLLSLFLYGCDHCRGCGPMPVDRSEVEGCGCVANPDVSAVSYLKETTGRCGDEPYEPSSSSGWSPAPRNDADAATDAGDSDADAGIGEDAGDAGGGAADGAADADP